MIVCRIKKLLFIYYIFGFILLNSSGICNDQQGETFFDLGVFAYEDKDYQAAETYLLKALSLSPDTPFYCFFLGKVYLAKNQFDKAETFLKKAYRLNPVMNGLDYDLAWLAFKQSKFQDAAHQFSTIVDNDPLTKNVLACYYAGISFFECRLYDKAIQYLMRAAERSPSIKPNSMYYCAICYYKQNNFHKAIQYFEYVLMHAAKQPLKEHAKNWLQSIRIQKSQNKALDCLIKLSIQADDNVMIVSPDWITGDESDGVIHLYVSGKYKFEPKKRHRLALGLRYYQCLHQDLSEYDLIGSIVDCAYTYQMPLIRLGLNYAPSSYWLEQKKYLMRHQWKSHILWKLSDHLMNQLMYSFYIQNHDHNSERDGQTHDIAMHFLYNHKANQLNLMTGFSAEENHRNDIQYQYEQLAFEVNLTKKLKRTWTFHCDLELSQRRHEQFNDKKIRKDFKFEWSCAFSKPFWQKDMEIWFDYSYTKNNSVWNEFDYRRNVFGISFVYQY
jgi:tetratricopeptide (TPR) repeat protein